jgi:hypothetical protein
MSENVSIFRNLKPRHYAPEHVNLGNLKPRHYEPKRDNLREFKAKAL